MVQALAIRVIYDRVRETADIYSWDTDKNKHYNAIRSAGDVGTAVKDFMMELEKELPAR